MHGRRLVVAIGGNSLISDAAHQSVADQRRQAARTTRHLAKLVAQGAELTITHGNGPQVGFILRRSELARHELHELPLDVCGADSQGAIGYALQQTLGNHLAELGVERGVVTLVTQVEIDPEDPAFEQPSKPIGSFMTHEEALLREKEGWGVGEDAHRGWRRVVSSPRPQRIVEIHAVRRLLDGGFVVITAGGGGIPVVADADGRLQGISAVIDKDLASALLANDLGADTFVISTGVEKVALHYGTEQHAWVDHLSLTEARRYLTEGTHFAAGSMRPKIEAVVAFLEGGGTTAVITDPDNIASALAGQAGTTITR